MTTSTQWESLWSSLSSSQGFSAIYCSPNRPAICFCSIAIAPVWRMSNCELKDIIGSEPSKLNQMPFPPSSSNRHHRFWLFLLLSSLADRKFNKWILLKWIFHLMAAAERESNSLSLIGCDYRRRFFAPRCRCRFRSKVETEGGDGECRNFPTKPLFPSIILVCFSRLSSSTRARMTFF